MKKNFALILALALTAAALLGGCTSTQSNVTSTPIEAGDSNEESVSSNTGLPDMEMNHPLVTMTIAGYGNVEIELYPEVAPNTVNNFISLVNDGYYDGLTFHRIIPGFMIQGGDPDGKGTGGPGYGIKGEFSDNGFNNLIKHDPGVLSMARSQNPDSAGSQFFIMHKAAPHLDGGYAAFGQVISGMEIIDKVAIIETGFGDKPKEPVVMESVTVDLKGYEAQAPEIIE